MYEIILFTDFKSNLIVAYICWNRYLSYSSPKLLKKYIFWIVVAQKLTNVFTNFKLSDVMWQMTYNDSRSFFFRKEYAKVQSDVAKSFINIFLSMFRFVSGVKPVVGLWLCCNLKSIMSRMSCLKILRLCCCFDGVLDINLISFKKWTLITEIKMWSYRKVFSFIKTHRSRSSFFNQSHYKYYHRIPFLDFYQKTTGKKVKTITLFNSSMWNSLGNSTRKPIAKVVISISRISI